jgi:hypothetical protein
MVALQAWLARLGNRSTNARIGNISIFKVMLRLWKLAHALELATT